MNRSAAAAGMRCVPADEDDEDLSIEKALAHLSRLEAMCEAVQTQRRSQGE